MQVQWVNHFDILGRPISDHHFVPVDQLRRWRRQLRWSSTGDIDSIGGDKVVQMALELQRHVGVRVFELSDPGRGQFY